MKRKLLYFLMFAFVLAFSTETKAQNEIFVPLSKKDKKLLKNSADTITTLKVRGTIFYSDIDFISSFKNLKSLDMGKAEFYCSTDWERNDGHSFEISTFDYLDKLVLPKYCTYLKISTSAEHVVINNLITTSKIKSIWSSIPVIVGVLEMPMTEEKDIPSNKEKFFPQIVKQGNTSFLNCWLQGNFEDNPIIFEQEFEDIFSYAFSTADWSDTLDLSKIQSKKIGAYAFSKCPAKYIILPKTIEEISDLAFNESSVETVEFTGEYAPKIGKSKSGYYDSSDLSSWNFSIVVPDGCVMNYKFEAWGSLYPKEKNGKTEYELTITKPGTLKNHLTPEIVTNIEKLTIKGVIYDTDVETIEECCNLTYLDLSHCYITKSPQTLKKEKADREAGIAFLQMLGAMYQVEAEKQYNQGQIGVVDAYAMSQFGKYAEEYANTIDELVKQDGIQADENCLCPSLCPLEKIVEYHMPIQSTKIDGVYSKNLEKVILPPKATKICPGAFRGCRKLKEIDLPNTLVEIGKNAFTDCFSLTKIEFPNSLVEMGSGVFKGCVSLTELDFSHTKLAKIAAEETVDYWNRVDGAFEGCEKLQEVRFPKTLSKVNDGIVPSGCVFYFYTNEPPRGYYQLGETIHIPKGTKNNWSKWLSKVRYVIDDL